MFDLITIGDCTFDTFIIIDDKDASCKLDRKKRELCFNYADKICLTNIDQSVGGNAANLAVGVRKLGLKTAIVTELGDDINGVVIRHELEAAGVDTNLVKTHKKKETRFSIVLNYQSERTILSYHAKRGYTFPKIPNTTWLYYTSLGKTFEGIQKKLEVYLKKNPDVKLAMNPGSYQMKKGLAHMRRMLAYTDVLFVNKEEAQKIAGKNVDIPKLFPLLHKKGAKTVVITDSTNGSFASDGAEQWFMKPYPIKPIARTGAGDSYASGFLGATIYGKNIPTAMQWGTANAGGVIQKVGAHKGLCTKRGVETLVKKYPKNKPKML